MNCFVAGSKEKIQCVAVFMKNMWVVNALVVLSLALNTQIGSAQKVKLLKFFNPYVELYSAVPLSDSTYLIQGLRTTEQFTAIVNPKGHVVWEDHLGCDIRTFVPLHNGELLSISFDGTVSWMNSDVLRIKSFTDFFRHRGIPAIVSKVTITQDYIGVLIEADRGSYRPYGMYIMDRNNGDILDRFYSKEDLGGYRSVIFQGEDKNLFWQVGNKNISEYYVYQPGQLLDTVALSRDMIYMDAGCFWNDHIYWAKDGEVGEIIKMNLNGDIVNSYEIQGLKEGGIKMNMLVPSSDRLMIVGCDYISGSIHGLQQLFVINWNSMDEAQWRFQDSTVQLRGIKSIANAFFSPNNTFKILGTDGLYNSGWQKAFLLDLDLNTVTSTSSIILENWYHGPTYIQNNWSLAQYVSSDLNVEVAIVNVEGKTLEIRDAQDNSGLNLPNGLYYLRPLKSNYHCVEVLVTN